jgi:hypothetical protein
MHDRVIGPFFFLEKEIYGNVYLDMLTNNPIPQLHEMQPTLIFQQDGAPPPAHWSRDIRNRLN